MSDQPCHSQFLDKQRTWLKEYSLGLRVSERGTVTSVGDGIIWVSGLPSAAIDDVLIFADGSEALVFDLNQQRVGAVLLHSTEKLTAGTEARLSPRPLSLPVAETLKGRIIDPMGRPLDDGPEIETQLWYPLDRPSVSIAERDFVSEPLYTGNRIIDAFVPIGHGQRQLLIGDEGLGRTSIAIDTVINQAGKGVPCIYVMVGQRRSNVVKCVEQLRENGALEYTTVVVGEASALPGLAYLAPMAGAALAEFWMDRGQQALVIYDDLSTHAKTYREISLLLRRPPGREAYPGDIFTIHARLLERATHQAAAYGGGSITALPIVETIQGEIEAYVPTNLISITDGQIYFDATLFNSGNRPAIDIGRSVSRIGGRAQHSAIKAEAGRLKLEYLQFLELEVFTRFGVKLNEEMSRSIQRGVLIREILKQDRLSPEPITLHLAWMIAFNDGLLDRFKPEQIDSVIQTLKQLITRAELNLDSARAHWSETLSDTLTTLNFDEA